MKISLDWLSDFVDLGGLSPDRVADRLTMGTAEVEGWERLERHCRGVLVAEVETVEELPVAGDHGRLSLATVSCGGRRFSTVCGAANVRPGLRAAFAPPGVTLAGGVVVGEAEVGGRMSQGVLCSPRELGMSDWHEGLLELPPGLEPGTLLDELVPATDVVFEVDNKSLTHRPDLWGQYGFARELAALFGRPLAPLPVADLGRFDHLPPYPVTVDDPAGCPCYCCLALAGLGATPSPLALQRRLHALGQRTYDLLVDLTNYIAFEIGQPTHAFDADTLRAIRVAPMGRAGAFVTLDGQERAMQPDDLMIWGEREPVAIAGVMGGLATEVTGRTTRLLLESANFRGARVRRTAVRLGLRTEASQRFEKNQPPVNARVAVARFLHLVEAAGVAPEVQSRFTTVGDLKDGSRPLTVPAAFLDAKAGQALPAERVASILSALGFAAELAGDAWQVGIPPHRSAQDISIADDIVEEVLRVYGYDNVAPRLPSCPIDPVPANVPLLLQHRARRLLAAGHGFVEVHTYSWFDDSWLERLGFDPGPTLVLRNPTAPHQARMRTTLVPNLLALVGPNRPHAERFRLFELGNASRPTAEGRAQLTLLAGLSYASSRAGELEDHVRAVRGVLDDLSAALGAGTLSYAVSGEGRSPWQAAASWLEVACGGRAVGSLGVLAGSGLAEVAQVGQVVWFELDLEALGGTPQPEATFAALPVYPGSWHDFSLVWPLDRGFAALESTLDRFAHPLLRRREFLYRYSGKGLEPGQGSFTFRCHVSSPDHTLSGEEIESFRAALMAFLSGEGVALR